MTYTKSSSMICFNSKRSSLYCKHGCMHIYARGLPFAQRQYLIVLDSQLLILLSWVFVACQLLELCNKNIRFHGVTLRMLSYLCHQIMFATLQDSQSCPEQFILDTYCMYMYGPATMDHSTASIYKSCGSHMTGIGI